MINTSYTTAADRKLGKKSYANSSSLITYATNNNVIEYRCRQLVELLFNCDERPSHPQILWEPLNIGWKTGSPDGTG